MVDLVDIAELHAEIEPEAPGILRPTMDRVIRQAAFEFCRKSGASRHRLDPITLIENQYRYDLDEDGNLQVREIREAVLRKTRRLDILSEQLLTATDPAWRHTPGNIFACCPSNDRSAVELAYTPTQVEQGALELDVVFLPTRAATQLDALVVNQYYDALRHGALSQLRMMRDSPMYDPQQAKHHRIQFVDLTERAKSDATNERVMKRRPIKYGGY